ncbi:MAG: ABC transporter permease, partial [Clostridia bacterium]|nr:ABC transporter permease [Clostridia bacterium]
MLFKLAFRNMRRSVKDYLIYFLTLVLGVSIFYMFNSLDSQEAVLKLNAQSTDLIKNLGMVLGYVSVFVAVVLGILIVYANQFLIKRRKKEFGLYMTLGMSKFRISLILLMETIFVGLLSLVIGLVVGIFLSQFMTIIMAKMFEANVEKFTFVFSLEAFYKTWIYFAIMYFASIIFNTIIISRYRLINLLKAEHKQKSEKVTNPVISIIGFLLGCAGLAYVYHYFVIEAGDLLHGDDIFSQLLQKGIVAIVCTFLIFWSISGVIMAVSSIWKKAYFKGTNMFVIKQVGSKLHTTAISMGIICLMLFVTVTMLSVSVSMTYAMNEQMNTYSPIELCITSWDTGELDGYGNPVDTEHEITIPDIYNDYKNAGYDMSLLKDHCQVNLFLSDDYTQLDYFDKDVRERYAEEIYGIKKTDDDYDEIINSEFRDVNLPIYRQSEYNQLAEIYGLRKVDLNDDEYAIVANMSDFVNYYDIMLGRNKSITVKGKTLKPKYNHTIWGFDRISMEADESGFWVVPDNINFSVDNYNESIMAATYNYDSGKTRKEIDDIFNSLVSFTQDEDGNIEYAGDGEEPEAFKLFAKLTQTNKHTAYIAVTKGIYAEAMVSSNTVMTFLAMYIGIVFLLAGTAILAIKQLSDNADNKHNYMILRKLGCDEGMINKTLFKQIL